MYLIYFICMFIIFHHYNIIINSSRIHQKYNSPISLIWRLNNNFHFLISHFQFCKCFVRTFWHANTEIQRIHKKYNKWMLPKSAHRYANNHVGVKNFPYMLFLFYFQLKLNFNILSASTGISQCVIF